jgi:hypothetical protein
VYIEAPKLFIGIFGAEIDNTFNKARKGAIPTHGQGRAVSVRRVIDRLMLSSVRRCIEKIGAHGIDNSFSTVNADSEGQYARVGFQR